MKEFVETISFLEAKELLRMRSNSTLANFFKRAEIKVKTKKASSLAKLLFDKNDLCLSLGIEKLPEKFLTIDEVALKLGISKNQVKYMCATGLIGYYQVGDKKGNKFLFVDEDIPYNQKLTIDLEFNSDFYLNHWKFVKYEKIIFTLLEQAQESGLISPAVYSIIVDLLKGENTLTELAYKHGISERGLKRYFFLIDGLVDKYFTDVNNEINLLKNRVVKLEAEIAKQKVIMSTTNNKIFPVITDYQISGADPFTVKLANLSFSARTHNAFINSEIETLGELINFQAYELLRIQNFGRKSLEEVRSYLKNNNFKLKND